MPGDGFETLAAFVEDELQFATSHYTNSYLDRRFSARVRRTSAETYREYLDVLRSNPDEQKALLDTLSVNVTGFFRNPDVWTGITEILRKRGRSPGRTNVWSAACADGREAYSVGLLAAANPVIDARRVSVLGTDINEQALQAARAGVYENTQTADLDDQLSFVSDYEQYIERSNETIRMRDTLKDRVSFEHHDLINDAAKTGFDLILCRNLFIYIDSEYKRPILETVADSLADGGYLVIGKAETIPPRMRSRFRTVDAERRIYQRL